MVPLALAALTLAADAAGPRLWLRPGDGLPPATLAVAIRARMPQVALGEGERGGGDNLVVMTQGLGPERIALTVERPDGTRLLTRDVVGDEAAAAETAALILERFLRSLSWPGLLPLLAVARPRPPPTPLAPPSPTPGGLATPLGWRASLAVLARAGRAPLGAGLAVAVQGSAFYGGLLAIGWQPEVTRARIEEPSGASRDGGRLRLTTAAALGEVGACAAFADWRACAGGLAGAGLTYVTIGGKIVTGSAPRPTSCPVSGRVCASTTG